MVALVFDDPEKGELFSTLLWLREQYADDVENLFTREAVLRRVDKVLDKYLPSGFKKNEGEI